MSRDSQLQNSSFNISPNFSSLGSLFSYPSRLLSRIRGIDSYEPVIGAAPVHPIDSTPTLQAPGQHVIPEVPPHSFPGPWGFFTSSYTIGLVLMMVLMHRIENVVVPTRVPHFPIAFHTRGRSPSRIMLRRLYDAFMPLDMTNTVTRAALHLPTLYFMGKSLFLWTLILLQASNLYPSISNDYMISLRIWSESQEMRDVCWQTFCAICGAFCVEAFVKGLDGVSVGIGAHMQANTSPFNLVGYAFLLYAYSSSYTHVLKPDGLPSRPDKHVLVTIVIPLLQLTIFHILSCRKRWSSHRLIPTALSSVLSLLHFHTTLFSHSMFESRSPDLSVAGENKQHAYSNPAGIGSYPILNYVPNLFETVLLLLISLTVLLNVATQLLLTGRVTKPLLGLGLTSADGGPTEGWSWSPPWEEDFGVVLLRVGTASLEATGLRGWGNEVTGVVASLPSDHIAASTNPIVTRERIERGTLKMNRNGVIEVAHGSVTTIKTRTSRTRKPLVSKRVQIVKGLDNEIRDVDFVGNTGSVNGGRRVYGVPGFFTVNRGWYWGVRALGSAIWSASFGLLRLIWDVIRGKKAGDRFGRSADEEINTNENQTPVDDCDSEDELMSQEETYEMFLRGDRISDDEGDDDEWIHESEFGSDEEQESNSVSDAEDERSSTETVALYSDLQTRGTSPDATSSAMLAHMAYSGDFPLTRRRYKALLAPSTPPEEGPTFQARRSSGSEIDPSYEDSRRNCVICTVEQRQIICWPCRCLTMCDQCRESLAARSSASKHRCPCCRRPIEGYSRIFIP
ncbi:hypothetical protein L218DRAFT_896271 [Marasmius fiardii PR-910]|nr:hypothetical protein L218DRAFT_896271 [Marasmius fiardii PR-910]